MKTPFKVLLSNQLVTASMIASDSPADVVVNGFEVSGESHYFKLTDGRKLFVGGKMLVDMAQDLLDEYDSADLLDSALYKNPVAIRIHPLSTLKSGRKFRRVQILGEVDE